MKAAMPCSSHYRRPAPSTTDATSRRALRRRRSAGYGRHLGVLALLIHTLGCHSLFADPVPCEDIPYNTGDRFLVTVTEILPVEPPDEPCVPLVVGDNFEVTVAEESPNWRECVKSATGEPIPGFIAPFVDSCEPARALGLACRGEHTLIEFSISTDARANETSPGTLWVRWVTQPAVCIQTYSVTLESLPPL